MLRLSPWWRNDVFGPRLPALRIRGRVKAAVRGWFADQGFDEVDTPVLQVSPGNETHIAGFATRLLGPDGSVAPMFLQSSPEFACKKLLAAGVPRLFTMAPVFRNRERGRLHHPEFTMLEWYRANACLDDLVADCAALLGVTARAAGVSTLRHRDLEADVTAPLEVVSVVDAVWRHAGIALDTMLPDNPGAFARLARATEDIGLRVASDDTWSDLFSKILSAHVEPKLGVGQPTVLTRYPASEAALARLCPDDPRFAERFELYACGVELANAFGELRDPIEQRRRFAEAEAERGRIYGDRYPVDEDFLDALAFMPEACGIALGFDRLVMLATGADHIEDVLWAPVAEAAS
jgi:lysyl-tRNA synthetase class 2